MRIEERVAGWRREGLISEQQAARMLEDLRQEVPQDDAETWSTSALLFAVALLNGLIILVFTAIADLQMGSHTTFLLWMVCILPMLYTLRLSAIAALFALLFLAWTTLFAFRGLAMMSVVDRVTLLPVFYLLCGTTLFAVGGAHYVFPSLRSVARALRLIGIQIAMLALFAMSVRSVAEGPSLVADLRDPQASLQLMVTLLGLAGVAAAFTLLNFMLRKRAPEITQAEGAVSLALVVVSILYYFFPLPAVVTVALYTVAQLALITTLLVVGYRRSDVRLVNIGSFSALVLLLVRTLELVITRFPLSVVVASVALALAIGGAALEVPRRRLLARLMRAPSPEATPGASAANPDEDLERQTEAALDALKQKLAPNGDGT